MILLYHSGIYRKSRKAIQFFSFLYNITFNSLDYFSIYAEFEKPCWNIYFGMDLFSIGFWKHDSGSTFSYHAVYFLFLLVLLLFYISNGFYCYFLITISSSFIPSLFFISVFFHYKHYFILLSKFVDNFSIYLLLLQYDFLCHLNFYLMLTLWF